MRFDLKKLGIPLLVIAAFLLLSIVPVFQMLFMMLDGFALSLVGRLILQRDPSAGELTLLELLLNLPLALYFLYLFYKERDRFAEVMFITFSMLFLNCMLVPLVGGHADLEDGHARWVVAGGTLLSGAVVCCVALLKGRLQTSTKSV